MPRLLTIMGSGETTPTMVKVHRWLFDKLPDGPAVLLDTPYGFQLNADDISERARSYFGASVGRRVDVVSWRRRQEPGLAQERALAAIRSAVWLFAGPGSPTYALRQWRDTPLPGALRDRLAEGGALVFASAAALTLGSHAVPVYEIYKAGEPPAWEPALDLLGQATGLHAAVIPHYNNAEGGTHDTRYCYLGEPRLAMLERELPDDGFVLGVDEHTACVLDLDARMVKVLGAGAVTIRRRGRERRFASGVEVPLAELAAAAVSGGAADRSAPEEPGPVPLPPPPLAAAADRCQAAFQSALDARDVDGCVAAMLDLEQTVADWAHDTSDELDHARALLRGMAVSLGELARQGAADPAQRVGPFVRALLAVREDARNRGDYPAADRFRELLAKAGVEVQDTPDGPRWTFSGE